MEENYLNTNVNTKNHEGNTLKTNTVKTNFSVVGIGASAGGLDPMLAFLGNVPENSGLAFIIVQHMEKGNKCILVDLLQSATTMKVVQVSENITIKPNCVYIIPPHKNMVINHNVLNLFDYVQTHKVHLPIDFFFSSLAKDKQEKSIGVILSGMGTDGTAGLAEIRKEGGGVFIQEPSSAKFDDMPRSAISGCLADAIGAVEILPSKIITYVNHMEHRIIANQDQTDKFKSYFDSIIVMLRSHTGHDFSSYKKNTVQRRIERCMGIHKIDDIATYVKFLKENPQELNLLFKEFLIGVTSFFREPSEWKLLENQVIPSLLVDRSPTDTLRVWISGCSTGEEAYSLAIVFKDAVNQLKPYKDFSMQIFATDLDCAAIDKAREGIFSENIAKDMSSQRLKKYFIKVERGYQVVKDIRNMVIFAQQNMIKDPPFTKIDILICRNVLIYLTPKIQKKLIPLFHYSLNNGGFLFLGSAESVGNFTDLFKPLDLKSRLYQRLQPLVQNEPIEFATSFAPDQSSVNQPIDEVQNMQSVADKLILQYYSPATVLVNNKGDILYITGRTGKYLEPASGKVNWNIFAMARGGLNYKLSDTFYKALRKKDTVTFKNAVVVNEGGPLMVDISVNPIKEPGALFGMVMIVFSDVVMHKDQTISATGKTPVNNTREEELEQELLQTRKMCQVTGAQMQISQEEFKSSNEELQSCNEELQSTNEELTTTKEEVQSSNEELKTMNFELQAKLNELSLVSKDMKNLMNSMEIATLFLDNDLLVKHFTKQMTEISRLIPSDIGRPMTDIASDLNYPDFTKDIRDVQHTSITVEKQIISCDGRWYNAHIIPYHSLEDKMDGVVITFVNITKSKMLEAALNKTNLDLGQHILEQDKKLLLLNGLSRNEPQLDHSEVAATKDTDNNKL